MSLKIKHIVLVVVFILVGCTSQDVIKEESVDDVQLLLEQKYKEIEDLKSEINILKDKLSIVEADNVSAQETITLSENELAEMGLVNEQLENEIVLKDEKISELEEENLSSLEKIDLLRSGNNIDGTLVDYLDARPLMDATNNYIYYYWADEDGTHVERLDIVTQAVEHMLFESEVDLWTIKVSDDDKYMLLIFREWDTYRFRLYTGDHYVEYDLKEVLKEYYNDVDEVWMTAIGYTEDNLKLILRAYQLDEILCDIYLDLNTLEFGKLDKLYWELSDEMPIQDEKYTEYLWRGYQ